MNNLEIHKSPVTLVAFEASGGATGGGGNCDDLSIQRDDINKNAGLEDSTSNIEIARALKLKKNRVRMYNIQKNKSIKKCEIWLEMECK